MSDLQRLNDVLRDETVEVEFLDGSPFPPLPEEEELRIIIALNESKRQADAEEAEEAGLNAGFFG